MTATAPATKRRRERPQLIGNVRLSRPEPENGNCGFPPEAYYRLYQWSRDVWHMLADDMTPTDPGDFVRWQESVDAADNVLTWGVWRGPELGGFMRFILDPAHPWMGEGHCLFKKDFWGRETTVPALLAVCRELFDERGIKKLNMTTFKSNHAIGALLKHVGAVLEGEIRRVYMQGGKLIDTRIWGLIPEDLKREA